jgi:asparagine synthase (glutamine-hydrolysing)
MRALMEAWRDYPVALRVDWVMPLMAQPVVETVLQIPTYTLSRHGISRGLARETFSRLLSPTVNNRRGKGSGRSIQQRLVLSNLAFIKASLLDGALVRHGVLDRAKLEAALGAHAQLRKDVARYVLNFLAVEFWLRSFEREREASRARRVA